MDSDSNNCMIGNRLKFLENKDNSSRMWCDTDNGGISESLDIDFVYDDTDTHPNEIAELYSYTEQNEFQLNVKAFEDQMESFNLPPSWQKLSDDERKSIIMKLLDQLDLSQKTLRIKAARTVLYLAQGCFAEVQCDQEQQQWTRQNVKLLYELGLFATFVELLNYEIENSSATNIAMRKVAVSLADSVDLRIILSVLYILTEVIRSEMTAGSPDYRSIGETFQNELNSPIGDELLSIKLLGMITRFCGGSAPHFPMKKVLLLLWKVSLVSLGGMDTLRKLKDEYRIKHELKPTQEDTLEVARRMRASSPPATVADMLDHNPKRNRPLRRSLMKQSSLDEQDQLGLEMESQQQEAEEEISDDYRPPDVNGPNEDNSANNFNANGPPNLSPNEFIQQKSAVRLPWAPKVRQKDIDQFLYDSRHKFIGYSFVGDHKSLAGLPQPIHEGFHILNRHMYTSLSDIHVRKEEEIARNPITNVEADIPMTPTEILYQAMLPNLPQCMIALLKILLAASPTSKAKTESINIMADVLPEEMPVTVTQSTKLGIDVNRHKEIIIKAVSAILLLYLKHFKINHVYQFEFMSQHLVFANCIPLVLKFFNQNLLAYIGSKNVIPIIDFPACIIGDSPYELTSESLVIGDSAPYSWRNIFSCINLLRILNKLTKWKHSRVMMLVVFKAAPILKRTLKVRHALMQLYVLKLLKMQTKYLGRQWRKTNMKIISAIYEKVRHRLNDDWAFGNDLDARPWDFQTEECTLRTCVDRFNSRRYISNQSNAFNRPSVCNILTKSTSNVANSVGLGNTTVLPTANQVCMMNRWGVSSAVGNAMLQQQQIIMSDINDQFDPDCVLDVNVNTLLMSGENDRNSYSPGFGGWDSEQIDLSDDFKQHYEHWLQREVYGMQINWDSLRSQPHFD